MTAAKHKPNWLGKPAVDMQADADAVRDAQPLETGCLFCGWSFNGTAAEGRERAREHRAESHPEAVSRRTRRKPNGYRLNAYVDDDLIAEQRERRRQREEAEQLAAVERGRQRAEAA